MANQLRYNAPTGEPCVLSHYDSVQELEADCLIRPMAYPGNAGKRAELDHPGPYRGPAWYGVSTLDDTKRILREGYPEGAALVDKLYDAVAPNLPRAVDFRRHRVRADQGDSLDIHAVNRGTLDKAWETVKRKAKQGTGLIRIAVDICGNGDVTTERLKWRGIAALALCRAMTKAGYSVEIVAGQSGVNAFQRKPNLIGTVTVTVKPRYAAVDTATLAATICLPGFFRYAGFASIIRQADDMNDTAAEGLGRAVKLETVLPVPEKIAQVVASESINDQATAEAWVRELLALLQGSTVDKEQQR